MIEILEHTLHDTLPALPLLMITYLILEYLEHSPIMKSSRCLLSANRFAPMIAALFGLIPQCSFSLLAAGLYTDHMISLGTLFAVFIATSDEAIPVLLLYPDHLTTLGWLLLMKLFLAIFIGYLIDFLSSHHAILHSSTRSDVMTSACSHSSHSKWRNALFQTIQVFIFIFIASFILTVLLHQSDTEQIEFLFLQNRWLQPILASVIGLIPNCASSIVLTELFVNGVLSFPALLSGLISNAPLGLMVLYRTSVRKFNVIKIIFLLFLISCASGVFLELLI